MSKLEEKFRTHKVFNTHEILSQFATAVDDIAVDYSRSPAGRMGIGVPNATRVWSTRFKTNPDPNTHWANQGAKHFCGIRKTSFKEALDWASEKYHISEWETCPMDRSRKIPKTVYDRALAWLDEQEKRTAAE